jgi:putative hydrolase of HD superfamily
MTLDETIAMLMHGNQLKRTARTGWTQRGVPNAENVAAHTFGVAYAALLLLQQIQEPLDSAKTLSMALLHDLPEGLTTDIPTPAWRYLPTGIKSEVERGAMREILSIDGSDSAGKTADLMAAWEELHANETAEAHLVHDADKIDMFLQALVYEEQTGNRHLHEFWTVPFRFHFSESQAVYDKLRQNWQKMNGGPQA